MSSQAEESQANRRNGGMQSSEAAVEMAEPCLFLSQRNVNMGGFSIAVICNSVFSLKRPQIFLSKRVWD